MAFLCCSVICTYFCFRSCFEKDVDALYGLGGYFRGLSTFFISRFVAHLLVSFPVGKEKVGLDLSYLINASSKASIIPVAVVVNSSFFFNNITESSLAGAAAS